MGEQLLQAHRCCGCYAVVAHDWVICDSCVAEREQAVRLMETNR